MLLLLGWRNWGLVREWRRCFGVHRFLCTFYYVIYNIGNGCMG